MCVSGTKSLLVFLSDSTQWSLVTTTDPNWMSTPHKTTKNEALVDTLPYKWPFVASLLLCLLLGITIAVLLLKFFSYRRSIGNLYMNSITPISATNINVYEICDETINLDMENRIYEQNRTNNSTSSLNENLYLTVM